MVHPYASRRKIVDLPRLPLEGSIDLTYRCNNRCRHCWLRSDSGAEELSADEIFDIVDQARAMGCRDWAISGGEPMLRPDFPEIFDYITSHSRTYSLNTNGTLITPEIAELMRRKGSKLIALYGATADIHDYITRTSGSFAATQQGMELLRESGAGFTVQLVPMRANFHQLEEMKALARSLSPHGRLGATWLFLSAGRDPLVNAEIASQRLSAAEVVAMEAPSDFTLHAGVEEGDNSCSKGDDRLFAGCIDARREFHVDPSGQLSFCCLIKDPALRYDLRSGSFREGWNDFIPSLANRLRGGEEFGSGCGSCPDRLLCDWCPAYGFLEHGRYDAPVEYLCELTRETRSSREVRDSDHRRFFGIGGVTIRVDADLPFTETTFAPKFDIFHADGPGKDNVRIHHHFTLPEWRRADCGDAVYSRSPWTIFRKERTWIYAILDPGETDAYPHKIAIFSDDHSSGDIYHAGAEDFLRGRLGSITMFPTDQILIARLLSDRDGCILHSAGAVMDGKGLLFIGCSGAGKTTISMLLEPFAEILCDDRNIVRRYGPEWKVFGTWSHGDLATVSPESAPLRAILFLEQSEGNRISPIEDKIEVVRRLLDAVIRPFVSREWWEKTLAIVGQIARDVPCYRMEFDKSGKIVQELKRL